MTATARVGTGTSAQFGGTVIYGFTSPDVLTTTDNALIPWLPGQGTSVSQAQVQVKTAPTGQSLIIALKIGVRSTGVLAAAFTTLTVTATSFFVDATFTPTLVDSTHFLAAEITQVGSGVAGSNLTVLVF